MSLHPVYATSGEKKSCNERRSGQGKDVVPIPGTKRRKYLEENAGALSVKLTQEDLRRLEEAAPRGAAAGDRYSPQGMRTINR